jgi:hypothetical protein
MNDDWPWRKSSYSGGQNNNCVEVATAAQEVGIRDSKDRAAGQLTMKTSMFAALVERLADRGSGNF